MAMAFGYESGTDGLFQSDTKSLEMRIRAAELGSAKAFTGIGQDYDSRREYFSEERSVVKRDMSKALAFYEVGAKKGSVPAHLILAGFHGANGDIQKSNNHKVNYLFEHE